MQVGRAMELAMRAAMGLRYRLGGGDLEAGLGEAGSRGAGSRKPLAGDLRSDGSPERRIQDGKGSVRAPPGVELDSHLVDSHIMVAHACAWVAIVAGTGCVVAGIGCVCSFAHLSVVRVCEGTAAPAGWTHARAYGCWGSWFACSPV